MTAKPDLESRRWKKISVAIALFVLVRGVCLLCVLPPFEGWDEYQHIAYIVHLREQKDLPRIGVTTVPQSIVEEMRQYPHSDFDNVQTEPKNWGARTYRSFWTAPQNRTTADAQPVKLYQAQQAPLYYVASLPLWLMFTRVSFLAGMYALRLANLILLALSVFVFLQTLEKCISDTRHRLLVGLMAASCPVLLITAARVSNDALSLFFGSLTLYFVISAFREQPVRYFILASACLALGILTRATMLTMVPTVIGGIGLCLYQKRIGARGALKAFAGCCLVLALFLFPFYLYNYKITGGFYLVHQHFDIQQQGKSTLWVFSNFFRVGWSQRLLEWLFLRPLWFSGWSFLREPMWLWQLYRACMYLFWISFGVVTLKRAWGKRTQLGRPRRLFRNNADALIFICVVFFMVCGLGYFSILGLADWGMVAIVPSYFMLAVPAWTALLYQVALLLGARTAFWFAHVTLAFYFVSEIIGTFYIMPRTFAATSWSWESWQRLAQIHPSFPGPWFIVPTLLIGIGLLAYLLRIVWKQEPELFA